MHLEKQQRLPLLAGHARTEKDRLLAAEELLLRRREADPSWRPNTTRARYLAGLTRGPNRLGDDEVAELLSHRLDRLTRERSEAERSEAERSEAERAKESRSAIEAQIEAMTPDELDELDQGLPERIRGLADRGNDLAIEQVREHRITALERAHRTATQAQPTEEMCTPKT